MDPIISTFGETAELVGLCDINSVRMNFHVDRMKKKYGATEIPMYPAADFDRMLAEQQPDTVIVCTVDSLHDEYIVRSLDAGCDVITEKPMTTDEVKCRRIMEAVERSGKSVRVTFNMRWMPGSTRVKQLVAEGVIGEVKSVVLEYTLDTIHGADYFRRWHAEKSKSGGLLLHKSTHHFDLVNWLVDSVPETVFALGGLVFYGRDNAIARGQEELTRYERYTNTPSEGDPFRLDLAADESLKGLYLEAEKEDGYLRDRNVFRAGIDIEDSVGLVVRYRNGVTLTYSLTAFSPVEGYRLVINGDKGRLEYAVHVRSHIIRGQGSEELANEQGADPWKRITVYPLFAPAYEVEIPALPGSHGGSDILLQKQMFDPANEPDPWQRDAGHEQGAASAAIGFAANRSMQSGQPVKVSDLLNLRPATIKLSELA